MRDVRGSAAPPLPHTESEGKAQTTKSAGCVTEEEEEAVEKVEEDAGDGEEQPNVHVHRIRHPFLSHNSEIVSRLTVADLVEAMSKPLFPC